MNLDIIFAVVVAVLAGAAVVGALIFVIVWEVCAIRRTLAEHGRRTRQPDPSARYWHERSAVTVPERRP